MRDILTIVASIVILVLTIALVGPWFVDWTAHRGWVESELSRISGWRVKVGGAIDLKLLPVPRIELETVQVASSRGEGPSLDMAKVKLELAAASLLRGDLRFTDAEVERPQLTLVRYEDGSFVLPRMPNFAPSGVQVERIAWRDGSVAFRTMGGGAPLVVGGLDFTGEAASLVGPFRGAGVLRVGADPIRYRFNTGQIEGDRLRVKAIVDESAIAPRADLEGALAFVPDGSGLRPVFDGTGAFSATDAVAGAPVPWRLAGPLKADTARATLEPADLRAGDEERAIAAGGAVRLDFAPGLRVSAQLAARQLDFDKLFAAGKDAAPAGRRLSALASAALADASLYGRLPFPVSVALSSPTATLAGETLTDLRAELALASGEAPRVKLSLFGPARSTLAMDGAVETGAAAAFRGHLDFSARDIPRFSDWLEQSLPGEAKRLRDLPFRALDLAGDVEISAAGALGRKLSLRLDRSELSGTMAFTRAAGREPSRLFADLTSDALDLDGLPELAGPARLAADMDLSLGLEARAVRLERFGAGFVDAGRIGLKFVKDVEGVRIERFAIENIGGANVTASARVTTDETTVDARLDAARLGELAALLQRVAPSAFADALAKRATALSPARLTLAARGRGANAFETVGVEGAVRGTRLSIKAKGATELMDIEATADNADVALLLRQAGFETLPLAGAGAGRMQLRAKGSPAKGFDASLVAIAARTEAAFEGRIALNRPEWQGNVRLRSPDAAPLLRVLAIVLPDADSNLPVDLTAQAAHAENALSFREISGVVSGAFVNGSLRGLAEGDARRWSGDLKVDRLDLPALASLALGPMAAPARGAIWPDQRLGPGLADPPHIDLRMSAGAFELSDDLVARDAAFALRISPGYVGLEDAQMKLGEGKIAGQLALRRDGASAAIAGKADLADVRLRQGPVTGAMSGRLEFTSTGQSYAALASGLAGGGNVQIAGLAIEGADPSAIARLIEAADRGGINIDENEMRARLLREVAARPLQAGSKAFDLSIAAGVTRLASAGDAGHRVELAYDLRRMAGEARVGLVAPQAPKDWSGAAPAATLVLQERAGAVQRSIDAGPLLNSISARAIAREAARVEALESDIRERAYFNRWAKAVEFMRRREREVAHYLEEQRRIQAEEARRRAEEERQRDVSRLPADAALGRAIENAPPAQDMAAQRRRSIESLKQRAEETLRAIQPRPTPPGGARPAPVQDPLASGPY